MGRQGSLVCQEFGPDGLMGGHDGHLGGYSVAADAVLDVATVQMCATVDPIDADA
jgi:hypothetical protein